MKTRFLSLISYFGIAVTISGIIFHLQGQGILGPEQSFMHKNQDWITYGMAIAFVGIAMTSVFTALRIRRR